VTAQAQLRTESAKDDPEDERVGDLKPSRDRLDTRRWSGVKKKEKEKT
jgi:hypothetical protein